MDDSGETLLGVLTVRQGSNVDALRPSRDGTGLRFLESQHSTITSRRIAVAASWQYSQRHPSRAW